MKLIAFLIVVFVGYAAASGAEMDERAWTDVLISEMSDEGAVAGTQLPDGSYPDIVTDTHAFEVDWVSKWKEGIGQARLYARLTGKKPGLLLLMKDSGPQNRIFYLRAAVACGDEIELRTRFVGGDEPVPVPEPPPPPPEPEPTPPTDRTIVPRAGWDTVTFPYPTSTDHVIADLDIRGGFRSCIMAGGGPHIRPVLRNLRLTEGVPYDPDFQPKEKNTTGTKWGSHLSGIVDGTIEDCVYEDIRGGGYLDAHGVYKMAYGDNKLLRSTFRNLGGQAVQYHFGQAAGKDPWRTHDASLLVEDVTIENTGYWPYMSGHAFTVRGEMYDATCTLRRVTIDIEWDEAQERYNWNCKSAGGLVFYGWQSAQDKAAGHPWDANRYSFALIELDQVKVRMVDPVSTILSINGAREIRLTNCEFRGERTLEKSLGPGVIHIDTNYLGQPGDRPKVQTAVFRGCKGNVPIKLNGVTIGTFDELGDFRIENGEVVR